MQEKVVGLEVRHGVVAGVHVDGEPGPIGAGFVITDMTGEELANLAAGVGVTKRALREWPRITPTTGRFVVSVIAGRAGVPAPLGPEGFLLPTRAGDEAGQPVTLGVIKPESSLLEPVRSSLETNQPVLWERVHDLPDFVYFNHAVHVNRGVSCVSCHGRIDKMEVVTQMKPLSMKWCLDCHRNPDPNIRDPELVTQLDFKPEGDPVEYGKEWAEKLQINTNISCSTCHR